MSAGIDSWVRGLTTRRLALFTTLLVAVIAALVVLTWDLPVTWGALILVGFAQTWVGAFIKSWRKS